MKSMHWIACAALAFTLNAVAQKPAAPKQVKVELLNAEGKNAGSVTFKTAKDGVKVKISLVGLPAGPHAVHIHQNPVCTAPDFKSAGGHFNPDGKMHGYLNPMGHHNGDMPDSVLVGSDTRGEAEFTLTNISLDPAAKNSIFANGGTSVVVHAEADDEKSDPAGNAGGRLACGVIKLP
jgi:Cu-Zn family superoxide dismutase